MHITDQAPISGKAEPRSPCALQVRARQCAAGEKEFRELSRDEELLLRAADADPAGVPIADFPPDLVHGLYRRHLVYVDVPVTGSQRFSTSSLEGFVSNRDLVAGDGDPMEALLYEVFVSNSERLRLEELADVLGKELGLVQQAMANAVRMGFAVLMDGAPPRMRRAMQERTRLPPPCSCFNRSRRAAIGHPLTGALQLSLNARNGRKTRHA